jgi:hypothetical protein
MAKTRETIIKCDNCSRSARQPETPTYGGDPLRGWLFVTERFLRLGANQSEPRELEFCSRGCLTGYFNTRPDGQL